MKRYLFLSLLILLIPIIATATINLNLEYPSFGGVDIGGPNCDQPGEQCDQELNDLVKWFYYLIIGVSGLAAFVMMIWGGIQWISSAGNPGSISDAKDRIQKALLGLLLVLGSFLILQIINPELTILKNPNVMKANLENIPEGITNVSPSDCSGNSPSSTTAKDPFGSPTEGRISSLFGYRGLIRLPGGGTTKNPCHTGIDIGENGGRAIKSPADGILLYAVPDPNLGLFVTINHGDYYTVYAHLRSFGGALKSNGILSPGIFIPRGGIIGTVGQTGKAATGEHLHYEIQSGNSGNVQMGLYNPNLSTWGVCGSKTCGERSVAVPVN